MSFAIGERVRLVGDGATLQHYSIFKSPGTEGLVVKSEPNLCRVDFGDVTLAVPNENLESCTIQLDIEIIDDELYDLGSTKKAEEKKPKFEYGEILYGYQCVTQLSTGYVKWVSLDEIRDKGIELAFYDQSPSFYPEEPKDNGRVIRSGFSIPTMPWP